MSNAYAIRTLAPRVAHVEIERMAAADLVMAARRAATIAASLTADECEQYAKRFEALVKELEDAVRCMRKGRPADHDHLPAIYRADGPALPERILLRAEADALVHD